VRLLLLLGRRYSKNLTKSLHRYCCLCTTYLLPRFRERQLALGGPQPLHEQSQLSRRLKIVQFPGHKPSVPC
jgi:hypothetical protein